MIIQDEALSPYLIKVDNDSFSVGKMTTIKKTGEEVFSPNTYHTTVEDAVLKVATLKMSDGGEFMSLKEYLTAFENIKNKILKNIKVSV